ncbi:MAG: Hsp20/alpha crystallin family protein [Planctomycetota bacterium]
MFTQRINGLLCMPGLRREVNRLFDNVLGTMVGEFPFPVIGQRAFPPVNVWEADENFFAEAEVPGLTMGDVELFVVNNELTIKGERREPESDVRFHRQERGTGKFARVIRLPLDVDSESVEATLKGGVLTIKLPKAKSVLPRKIEVKG